MRHQRRPISDEEYQDAALVWDYHQMHHELRPCSAGIALGGPDPDVADFAAELYHRGLFPVLVFTGANSPDTVRYFPRGEAVHNRERAVELGVPADAALVEPNATNTGLNMTLSRQVLADAGVQVDSVMLVSMPYMERRGYATCRKVWPEVDVVCASKDVKFDVYADEIDVDPPLVLDMMIGDMQRVMEYPKKGFAIEQDVPSDVLVAYQRLVAAGYTSRLADV